MIKKMKKTTVIFLGLLLCIMILPKSVSAEENEAQYQKEENGQWIKASFSEACENVYDGGVIKLLSNVKLTSTQEISKSVTITSSDKDNPYCISATSKDHGYLLSLKDSVTLEHIILDGGSENGISASRALVSVNSKESTVTISEGAILQNNNNITIKGAGGGLCLISGNVDMNGGRIQNCSAQSGGGVAILNSQSNKFVLNSGSITGNNAWGDSHLYGGGGVYITTGTFEMNDGIISKNQGYAGGAIFINNPYSAYLKMTGGNMTENQAKYGGGIYSSQIKLMELYGGKITDNVANTRGGGVLISPIGQVSLKGSVVVDNNISKGDNSFNNFYLEGNPNDSSFKADVKIAGALEGAKIGVSTMFDPAMEAEGKLYIIDTDGTYSIKETDFNVFYSDDEAYHILKSENQLYLQPHSYGEWQFDEENHWKTCECGIKKNMEPHKWDEGTIIKESSCDTTGIIEYKCSVCGYKHEEIIKADDHKTELQNVKEATCTEEGYTGDKVCTVCGDVIEKGSIIPKLENKQCSIFTKTGDNSNLILWIVLMLIAAGGICGTMLYSRKKKNNK